MKSELPVDPAYIKTDEYLQKFEIQEKVSYYSYYECELY